MQYLCLYWKRSCSGIEYGCYRYLQKLLMLLHLMFLSCSP